MKRLGRPPHADILTPREWEVLDLLREGLTNEQIARRLGITEGGVKFHVSSILGKLGVESRQEAARWQTGRTRQWSLGGLMTVTLPKLSVPLPGKLLAAAGVGGLAIGLLSLAGASPRSLLPDVDLGAILASERGTDRAPVLTASPAPPPTQSFGVFGSMPVATWGAADQLVDFHVLRPAYVPEGLSLDRIVMSYFPPRDGSVPSFPTTRNGSVTAYFVSGSGYLLLHQGWGMGPPTEPIPAHVPHGEITVGEYTATWIEGSEPGRVGPPNSSTPVDFSLRLGWRPDPLGATGPGWLLSTNFLTLEELIQIAASLH